MNDIKYWLNYLFVDRRAINKTIKKMKSYNKKIDMMHLKRNGSSYINKHLSNYAIVSILITQKLHKKFKYIVKFILQYPNNLTIIKNFYL